MTHRRHGDHGSPTWGLGGTCAPLQAPGEGLAAQPSGMSGTDIPAPGDSAPVKWSGTWRSPLPPDNDEYIGEVPTVAFTDWRPRKSASARLMLWGVMILLAAWAIGWSVWLVAT